MVLDMSRDCKTGFCCVMVGCAWRIWFDVGLPLEVLQKCTVEGVGSWMGVEDLGIVRFRWRLYIKYIGCAMHEQWLCDGFVLSSSDIWIGWWKQQRHEAEEGRVCGPSPQGFFGGPLQWDIQEVVPILMQSAPSARVKAPSLVLQLNVLVVKVLESKSPLRTLALL
ncbi:uncharacterized protein LOC121264011 isoform X2 [Juglans microcarpa x Juglans regia]|uniref:uncharacterized protein LOC121264011 isoform X2 n=2 Tax=Juglans microcarpa x Juglans regia TaxID=2249226 RepID=UPI001B7E8E8C|nr:uncharacterized protein LOC121264011 isoform X2 [Juglans microcarpa x Juglans regia]